MTKVESCTCNEMDYECDLGYARAVGGGPCLDNEAHLSDAEKERRQQEIWAE